MVREANEVCEMAKNFRWKGRLSVIKTYICALIVVSTKVSQKYLQLIFVLNNTIIFRHSPLYFSTQQSTSFFVPSETFFLGGE
jgi:hypothetical protein